MSAPGNGVNPLRDPQDRRLPKVAGPCGMVIFGVTGDLARKKLIPAVYDLANRGLLPPGFVLLGSDVPGFDAAHRLTSMIATVGHRGPDDQGVWFDGVCGLAHARLSIIDLSPAGHQPMGSADGRILFQSVLQSLAVSGKA